MTKKYGFTLVELLVVIAVIGVLIALLLPVLSSARKNAQKARCANNLEQIKRFLDSYTTQYDGRLPKSANWKPLLDSETGGASRVFICPSADPNLPSTYSINTNVAGASNNDVYLSQVSNTAEVIFVADGINNAVTIADGNVNDERTQLGDARTRHLKGANYLLLNGSVKYWVPIGNATTNSQGMKWGM